MAFYDEKKKYVQHSKSSKRNWWLIKNKSEISGTIQVHEVVFPKKMIGKKVRLIVELVDDKELTEK